MADNDILTLAEARTAVNLGTNTNQDTQLEQFLTGISQRIDILCGPVVIRTVTNERHDGGVERIFLDETPVSTVATVVEWRHTTSNSLTAESDSSKPADAYLLDNTENLYYIWRRSGGSDARFPEGRRNVVVTYDAGRAADTASVDDKFQVAASSILRRLWKREQSAWAQTSEFFSQVDDPATADRFRGFFRTVDPVVKELLPDELKHPIGL